MTRGRAVEALLAQRRWPPRAVLTCWVALSDAPEAAGCPRVIPKLHRRGPMGESSRPPACRAAHTVVPSRWLSKGGHSVQSTSGTTSAMVSPSRGSAKTTRWRECSSHRSCLPSCTHCITAVLCWRSIEWWSQACVCYAQAAAAGRGHRPLLVAGAAGRRATQAPLRTII